MNGNVLGAGGDTLQLGGTGTDAFDLNQVGPAAQYRGFTTFNKVDTSTWTVTGAADFTGGTSVLGGGTLIVGGSLHNTGATFTIGGNSTVDLQAGGSLSATTLNVGPGTLQLSGSTALTGDIVMSGGTLRSLVSGTLSNNLAFNTLTSSVVSAGAGQTLTFGPNGGASHVDFLDNSVATFGSPIDTGTVVIASDFNTVFSSAQVVVAGGTLRDGNGTLGNALSFMQSTTVNAGATLDMNDQAPAIHNLLGSGNVIIGTNPASVLFLLSGDQNTGNFSTNLFAGVISGPGGVEWAR
jgi:fibronectin-binding autotransporter adhesin